MTVVVIAGRRIDADGTASPQFPLSSVPAVAAALDKLFQQVQVTTLVSSGACGVDLLAIQAAARLGARTRLILPFSPEQFKTASVTDRPGDWEVLYDTAVRRAAEMDDLVVLELPDNEQSFLDTNQRLIEEALNAAEEDMPQGVVVWNGARPDGVDVTADFARRALTANYVLHTLPIPLHQGGS